VDPTKPFFQIATGLIPTLLLGGLIAERVRPPEAKGPPHTVTGIFAITAFFFLPAFAEVLAIHGAIVGEVSEFSIWVVAAALAFGTYVLALIVVKPWMDHAELWPTWEPGRRTKTSLVVLATVALIVQSVVLLRQAVSFSRAQQDRSQSERQLAQVASRDRFIRQVDATERVLLAERRVGRPIPSGVTDDALLGIADVRLAAAVNTGPITDAEQRALTETLTTYRKALDRARRR